MIHIILGYTGFPCTSEGSEGRITRTRPPLGTSILRLCNLCASRCTTADLTGITRLLFHLAAAITRFTSYDLVLATVFSTTGIRLHLHSLFALPTTRATVDFRVGGWLGAAAILTAALGCLSWSRRLPTLNDFVRAAPSPLQIDWLTARQL